jgi:hypothetical protein
MADPWVPEPGSVVRYGYDARDGTLRHGGDAIVDHLEGGRLMLTAWRSQHGGLLIMDNKDETPKAENENQLYDLLNDPEKIEYYLSRWGQYELEDNG